MENLEEELGEIINATAPDVAAEIIATMDAGPPSVHENLNDTVEIIENPIEVLDLTSPQPSTSSSNSAGAVGASSSVKRNLEEALKETNTDQNPSTSSTANTTSSSSSTGNSSNLLECPICLQTCIHPARLPCGHIFCFLCVKGVAYKNRRCAMCRREIPPEFLDHPQLVNGIEDICTTKATDDGYQWFYEGRNGGWWAYETRNASEIEEAFQNSFNKYSFHQLLINAVKKGVKKEDNKRGDDNADDDDDDDDVVDVDDGDDEVVDVDDGSFDSEGEAIDKKKNILNPFTYNIQICGTMYTVDFQNMIQYPTATPYRKRKICRAKGLPAKGVAGILSSKRKRRMKPY